MRRTGEEFTQNQKRAPLFEALVHHKNKRPHSFHVPGHKLGASFDKEANVYYQHLLPLDMTEISGLDDLHQPEGIIAEAQALAAEAYGAEETKFLVGGSTAGNIALILAVCKPGDKILVQRNCHKSVYHGIYLAKAEPIYIVPTVDPQTGVAIGVRREDVERALQTHPDAKAVFLTNPTYYGMGIDLAKMATTVHRFDIPLLIDEAHGAHYGFHEALPMSAMQCGADAAVQSTHKMGTSMTMSSMLHIQGQRIDRARLARALAMIQSSSPSYPLMASLDAARRHMVLEGRQELDRLLPLVLELRERLQSIPWVHVPSLRDEARLYATLDPLKLMLSSRTRQVSGFLLQQHMEERGIFIELADVGHALLVLSTGTSHADLESVWKVIESLPVKCTDTADSARSPLLASSYSKEQAMPLHQAMDAHSRTVPLADAAGAVCAEMIIPYPPGIPLLVPGERIDVEAVQLLQQLRENEVRFHGVKDAQLQTVQVIA